MKTSESEIQYFDEVARLQGDFNPFEPRGWHVIGGAFLKAIPSGRISSLLDVGCGTGQSQQIYAGETDDYFGIDLSLAELGIARQKAPSSNWAQADASQLPFANATFAAVAFSSVLHHIPDFVPALAEAWRVLRPGGTVFAFDPNLLHPAMALFRWPKSPLFLSAGVSPNEAPLLPHTLRRGLAEAGFVGIRQRCQSGIPYRHVAPPVVNRLLSIYNVADRLFEWVGLGRWFGTFIITSGRKP